MASITLQGVWLAPLSDLSDQLCLNAGVAVDLGESVAGRLAEYAAERIRSIKRPGKRKEVSVTVNLIDRETREALEALTGKVILIRDGRGLCFFGVYFDLKTPQISGIGLCDASFTVGQVTHSLVV